MQSRKHQHGDDCKCRKVGSTSQVDSSDEWKTHHADHGHRFNHETGKGECIRSLAEWAELRARDEELVLHPSVFVSIPEEEPHIVRGTD
jgi:hypothetical protein